MSRPDDDQLCWDWNPGRPAAVEDTAIPGDDRTRTLAEFLPPGTEAPCRRAPAPIEPTARRPAVFDDLANPMAAFTLHNHHSPITIDPDATLGIFAEPPGGGVGGTLPAEPPGRRPLDFPQTGDGIAGFRLLSELGRGAFGRVFLAEESLLGNRLVALKVTRAEGDEPRILARLQHTHIVPIHSVHDDPKTGLRVMCMPYVGGANLAQILEATSAAQGDQGDERSLLKALDIVGLPPPSEAGGGVGSRRRRMISPSAAFGGGSKFARPAALGDTAPGQMAKTVPPTVPDYPTCDSDGDGDDAQRVGPDPSRSGSLTRWQRLGQFPRWSRSIARVHRAWPRGREARDDDGNDRDPVQPARRFLREASFIRAAVWVIARLAEGLEHAHAHGLLHRDLKPSNILIAADGTPMLLDFNLAADSSAKANEEDRGKMGGTLPYMAPEHLDAFHPEGTTPPEAVNEQSDVYALGLILFEMIIGHRPFAEPEPSRPLLDVIRDMATERRAGTPTLRSLSPAVPRDLDAVVRMCLHPDPERRHLRAGDLAEDLRRFLDDQPLKYTPEPTVRGRVAKWVRRNPRATGASTVGLVGLVLIIGLSAAAWSVSLHLTQVSARLKLKGFEARFPECQFLLNTVTGPAESLGKGITLAEDTLEQAGISLDPKARTHSGSWINVLSEQEQGNLRRDLAEVILLLARARVYLADQTHSAAEQRRATLTAVAWLDRAEAIDPVPTVTLYDDRAHYLDRLGARQRAAADRSRRDAISPSTGRDYYLLGTSRLSKGQPDRAEAALIKAVGLTPQGFWPWFALGLCHYDQQRYAESAGDFSVCSVLSPGFAWPWMNLGLALGKSGRLIEARAAYDHALAVDGSMSEALANRGLIALELNDTRAAVADLERAIDLGHRSVDIKAALGEALGRAGRTDEANRLLDDLVLQHPRAILPRIARGTLRLETDRAGAEADFHQILELVPRHPGAFLGLARLRRKDNLPEALRYARLALECEPNRVDTVELCAWLRGSLGDPGVLEDVARLVRNPTSSRLYDAACSLSLYIRHHPDATLADRAVGYLRRAIQSGFDVAKVRIDPDLTNLHGYAPFDDLIAPPPAPPAPKSRP